MPKNLGLSSPFYEIPFDDNTLIVMGRMAVIWGQIVFHLDVMLKELKGMSSEEAKRYETKSLRTKLADLWTELSKPENASTRLHLRRVHEALDQISSDRNVVFHGLWGYALPDVGNTWHVAAKSMSRDRPFFARDLKALHERMIGASDALDRAFESLGLGHVPRPTHRNRTQLWVPGDNQRATLPPLPSKFAR